MFDDVKLTSPDHPEIDSERLRNSVANLLGRTMLCTMATVTPDNLPYANTCFFAVTNDLSLVVLTPPTTKHSTNLSHRPDVSVTVFDSSQVSGNDLQGLQLFGICHQASLVETPDCLLTYGRRFASLTTAAPDVTTFMRVFQSRFFKLQIDTIKIFDEPVFGKETWVNAQVTRLR